MKLALITMSLMGWVAAFADHTGEVGSIDYLSQEAQELNQFVQSSTLRYPVRAAVSDFNYRAHALHECSHYYGGSNAPAAASSTLSNLNDISIPIEILDHTGGGVGCPQQCRNQLSWAQYTFRYVERYLYDAYDYPQIYQQYLRVRQALYAIQ
ncbi:MAG: hypothetical protein HYR96_09655 [Deltaproteobacteria bacterium]|nr:hypothetical protein [Deltaproteobacteria bacterium]